MDLTNAIIRIVYDDDETVGTGFIVANDLAITCAHVVDKALRRLKEESHDPPPRTKAVKFFFYATGDDATATVEPEGWEGWYDPNAADFAILRLDSFPLRGVEPLPLGLAKDLAKDNEGQFRSFGFPIVGDRTETHVEGDISGLIENNQWLQITSEQITRGVSGGPVVNTHGQAIGIINHFPKKQNPTTGWMEAGDEHGRHSGTNYATPTEVLIEIWPELKAYLQPDPYTQKLEQYREYIDKKTRYVAETEEGRQDVMMKGMPLPPEVENVPLDKIYIQLQAVAHKVAKEQRDREQLEREETARAELSVPEKERPNPQSIDHFLFKQYSEQFYRQRTSYRTDEQQKSISPVEALKKHKRLVVLGTPGAGKSTLLRWLARQTLKPDNELSQFIPVLVSARDFSTAYMSNRMLNLRNFAFSIIDETQVKALKQVDNDGKVLWLVDALDEARGDYRKKVIEQVQQLGEWVVVSSRPTNNLSGLRESGFEIFEVASLVPENVDKFIMDWFRILAKNHSSPQTWIEDRCRWFKDAIDKQPQLEPLTTNPLLLTFLVILASEDDRQTLPENRSKLYQEYIEKLIINWERQREAEEFGREGKRILTIGHDENKLTGKKASEAVWYGFVYLGWQLHQLYYGKLDHQPDKTYLAEALADFLSSAQDEKIKAIINVKGRDTLELAETIIDFWLEAGLLDTWETDNRTYYTFRHFTFQEYAVAKYLHQSWNDDTWQEIKPHLHRNVWREPLLLLASLMNEDHLEDFINRVQKMSEPFVHPQDFFKGHKFAGFVLRFSIFSLNLIILPLFLLLSLSLYLLLYLPPVIVAVVFRLFQDDHSKSQTDYSNQYIGGFYAIADEFIVNGLMFKYEVKAVLSAIKPDIELIPGLLWWLINLALRPILYIRDTIYNTIQKIIESSQKVFVLISIIYYARSIRSNKKSLMKIVSAATQRETLLAAALIAENPAKVNSTTVEMVAQRLAELMRSDIPSLAWTAAEAAAAAVVSEEEAGLIMLDTLVQDFDTGHNQVGGYVLLQQARQQKMSLKTFEKLISKIKRDTNYVLLSRIKSLQKKLADIDDMLKPKHRNVTQFLYLGQLLYLTKKQKRNNSDGYYWLLEILSYHPKPPNELVQIIVDEVERSTTEFPKSGFTIHLAQCLVQWKKATSAALTVLASEVYGETSSKELLDTIATGFSTGQISGDIAERLIRNVIQTGDEEGIKAMFAAIWGAEQPYSDVAKTAVLVFINIVARYSEDTRRYTYYGREPYPEITSILSRTLTSDAVKPATFKALIEALEEGLIHDNYYEREAVIEILDKTLQSEPNFNLRPILQVLLKALDSDEYQVRLSAATAIKNAVKADIISGELLEDLGPFWRAARDNLENPQSHPYYFGYAAGNQYAITDEVAGAHLHLTPRDKLPQLPPGNSFDDAGEEIRSDYKSRLEKVSEQEKRQEKAVKKTPEEINAIKKMPKSPDQDQKIEAMQKLRWSIIDCSIDTSYITLITDELDNDEHHIRREAFKLLSSITGNGVASSDLAKTLYQKLCPIDEATVNVNEEILDMLASIAKLGYIQEAWLESFITLYDDIRKKASEDEKLISGLPGYESAAKLADEWLLNLKERYGEKWYDYLTIASNVKYAQSKMRKLTLIVANAALNDVLTPISAQFLRREDIFEFFQNKPFQIEPFQIEVYGKIAQHGFASPELVKTLLEFFQNPPTYSGILSRERTTRPEIIYALGQVYSGNPALGEQVLPTINRAISKGYYEPAIKILEEDLVPAQKLAPAILESFNTSYGISDLQIQLLGQLSTQYQHPIPLQYVQQIINYISKELAPMTWDRYYDSLGLFLQQKTCETEVFHLIVSWLLYVLHAWGSSYDEDEYRKQVTDILVSANVIQLEQVNMFHIVFCTKNSKRDSNWLEAARAIGLPLNSQDKQSKCLLSTLYYIVEGSNSNREQNIVSNISTRLLGFVDSQENTECLLDILSKPDSESWHPPKLGAIFALTQIGIRHSDRQVKIITAFQDVFFEESTPLPPNGDKENIDDTEHITKDIDNKRHIRLKEELKKEIITAIGTLQNSSLAARKILLKALESPSSTYSFGPDLPILAAEAFASISLQPHMSEEITKLLMCLSSSNDRLCDAAWLALNTLDFEAITSANAN